MLKLFLNSSNALGTYSNDFKTFKSIKIDYWFTQFGYQLLWEWPLTPGGPRLQKYSSDQKHLYMTSSSSETCSNEFLAYQLAKNDYWISEN